MVQRVPMVGRSLAVVLLAGMAGSGSARARSTNTASSLTQTNSSSPASASSSAPGTKSGPTGHRTKVAEEVGPPAELTKAEDLIQKRDYAGAEPLLRTVVNDDPTNYEAWFDLGFAENALGKIDDSIAAYRKAVAAKPDVFESNLNLGLQLAKTGQPDAEEFLRAATHLKPTSRTDEGQYRAWLSLAEMIEKSKPEQALAAYQQAATLQPKEAEPHVSAGHLLEQENKFADAEREYKLALALDSHSTDAVIGLANIYMRGRRFPEAEDYLRKLLAIDANSGPVHIQLGRVLAAEGKTDAAIAELQAGIKLSPGDDAAKRDLAELYTTAGKNDLAE